MNDDTTANAEANTDAPAEDTQLSAEQGATPDAPDAPDAPEQQDAQQDEIAPASAPRAAADNGVAASAPQGAPAPQLAPVERMEVRIDFEVGRVVLPIASLANVAAGSVIEVPSVSLDRVVAKSGGHAFAFGEFVELGGRVGFRITKLADGKERR